MPNSAIELVDPPAAEIAGTEAGTEIADPRSDEVVAADLLVEEISIDGMCGVY
jgi:mycofactocin precursor